MLFLVFYYCYYKVKKIVNLFYKSFFQFYLIITKLFSLKSLRSCDFRFLEDLVAAFDIFSTESAEEILPTDSCQVVNNFKYWWKDLQGLCWFLKVKFPDFYRLSQSKLVNFSRQNSKNWVIFSRHFDNKSIKFFYETFILLYLRYMVPIKSKHINRVVQ